MKIETIAPTETPEDGPVGDLRRSHPAFGVISAHRVSGGPGRLFGSPLRHNGHIRIAIETAEEVVSFTHSHYWPKGEHKTIAEIAMSEAQWAAFVSCMNVGSGTPCTLEYARDGATQRLPYIADDSFEEKRAKDIRNAVEKQMEQLKAAISEFDRLLAQPSISKKELKALRGKFTQPVDHAASNMEFNANMLTEHGEKLVESAKAEVSSMVMRMHGAFPQLAGQSVSIGQIEDKSGDGD